jgi:hypothetical protein
MKETMFGIFKKIKEFFFPPKPQSHYSLSSHPGIQLKSLPDLDGVALDTYWALDPVRTCYEIVKVEDSKVTISDINSGKEHIFDRELFLSFFSRLDKPETEAFIKSSS